MVDDIDVQIQKMRKESGDSAVLAIMRYAAELEPHGQRTAPPPWYKRKWWRFTYKLKAIIEIIKER